MWLRNDKFVSKEILVQCQWGVKINTEVWFNETKKKKGKKLYLSAWSF